LLKDPAPILRLLGLLTVKSSLQPSTRFDAIPLFVFLLFVETAALFAQAAPSDAARHLQAALEASQPNQVEQSNRRMVCSIHA
jgi:hypothetical protein